MRPTYLGDYYPLMPYNVENDRWIGWQFNVPERGEGVVQAFRRSESPYESIRVTLQGLEGDAIYSLSNLDIPGDTELTGANSWKTV